MSLVAALFPGMNAYSHRDLTVAVVGFTSWAAVAWKVSRVHTGGDGGQLEASVAVVRAPRARLLLGQPLLPPPLPQLVLASMSSGPLLLPPSSPRPTVDHSAALPVAAGAGAGAAGHVCAVAGAAGASSPGGAALGGAALLHAATRTADDGEGAALPAHALLAGCCA